MKRPTVAAVGAVGVLAMPVAAWWLIGDQSTTDLPRRQRDYMLRAPDLDPWVTPTFGVLAFVCVLVSLYVLVGATGDEIVHPGWLGVLCLLMFAGVVAGGIGRITTAGVIGANIGGGLVVLFGVPVLLILVGFAAVVAWLAHRADRTPNR